MMKGICETNAKPVPRKRCEAKFNLPERKGTLKLKLPGHGATWNLNACLRPSDAVFRRRVTGEL
jgi:hypothetical protein